MALVTHQMQGPRAAFPARPFSWIKGFKLKQHVSTVHMFGRTDRHFSVKHNFCLRACFHGTKAKFFKISAFKGSAQYDPSRNRSNGSKISQNSVKFSYAPKESGENIMESPKVHNIPVSYTSKENERIAGSPTIHKLFRKWLNILRTQSPNQVVDELLGEGTAPSEEVRETQSTAQTKGSAKIPTTVWSHFLGLDATIKIPLLIFIPFYLSVNVVYGVEVSKELAPLWILGPLIVSLYIRMLRLLWALYVFSFRQTIKLVRNLPTYHLLASNYMKQGRLKEDIQARVLQPVISIKNLDYKELARRRMKEFSEWFLDNYLDFVESIWPFYCRTIRFLKRANLI